MSESATQSTGSKNEQLEQLKQWAKPPSLWTVIPIVLTIGGIIGGCIVAWWNGKPLRAVRRDAGWKIPVEQQVIERDGKEVLALPLWIDRTESVDEIELRNAGTKELKKIIVSMSGAQHFEVLPAKPQVKETLREDEVEIADLQVGQSVKILVWWPIRFKSYADYSITHQEGDAQFTDLVNPDRSFWLIASLVAVVLISGVFGLVGSAFQDSLRTINSYKNELTAREKRNQALQNRLEGSQRAFHELRELTLSLERDVRGVIAITNTLADELEGEAQRDFVDLSDEIDRHFVEMNGTQLPEIEPETPARESSTKEKGTT